MPHCAHLFMVRPHLEGIPPPELPARYSLRPYSGAGDAAAWLEIIRGGYGPWTTAPGRPGHSRMGGGDWPADAFERFILSEESFRPERLFFIASESGRLVGTAAALQKLFHGDRTGYVHMMAVLPEHRRRGLGAALLRRSLLYFREQGWRDAALDTEVSRVEAIRLYLAHGFAPAPEIAEDLRRWREVLAALGRPGLADGLRLYCFKNR